MKRLFDLISSVIGILLLSPVILIISGLIVIDSKGGVFFRQLRVGRYGKDFYLLKFRTMRRDSDKKGLLTVGSRDSRVTTIGYYLRKYKLDELPQLINVITGDMSLVGPRPEVRKYVDLYDARQRQVLEVPPGITDLASLEYFDENELLAKSDDPEETYIREVMPAKLDLNLKYIREREGIKADLKIILKTIARIFR